MQTEGPRVYLPIMVIIFLSIFAGLLLYHWLPHYYWENETLHDNLEAMAGLAAFITALILFLRHKQEKDANLFILGLGFLSLGLFTSIHAISQPDGAFIWLRVGAGFTGSFWFLLLCLPENIKSKLAAQQWLPWVVAVGSGLLGLRILHYPDTLSAIAYNREFTNTGLVISFLTGMFYLAGAWRLLRDFKVCGRRETYLFACMALLFGLSGPLFKYADVWSWRWWMNHLMNEAAYILGLGFVIHGYHRMCSELNVALVKHREAEESLRFTQFAVERISDAAFWMGPEGKFIYVNEAACRNLGYSREELLQMTVHDIDANFPPGIWQDHWKEIKEQGSFTFESHHQTKDGQVFPVEVTVNYLEFGGREYNCAFARDITGRIWIEEALRETTEKMQTLIQASPLAIIATDLRRNVTIWNPAAERIFGWRVQEVMGRPIPIIPEGQQSGYDQIRDRLYSGKTLIEWETCRQRKDGSLIDVSISKAPLRNAEGEIIGSMGVIADITERKRMEEALRETTEKLQAVVRASPLAIVATDLSGKVTMWNPAAERMFGWNAQEIIQTYSTLFLPPGQQDKRQEMRQRVLQGEAFVEDEALRQKKDGSIIDVSIYRAPLRDAKGEISGIMGVIADITERKRAEAALRDSEARYRYLFENNPFPMWVYDIETLAFLTVNEAAVQHYGYSREEFLGMTIKDIHPSELTSELMKTVTTVKGELRKVGVWPQLKKDGSVIQVEISTHDLIYTGRKTRLVLANDITERKRAEEALEKALQNWRSTFEGVSAGLWILDRGGEIILSNGVFERMLGLKAEDLEGQYCYRLAHGTSDFVKTCPLVRAKRSGKREIQELEDKKRGIWLEITVDPIYDKSGTMINMLHAVRDITERKQAEAALRDSEERYRTLFNQATDGIFIIDTDGNIVDVNISFANMHGYTLDEMRKLDLYKLDTPETAKLIPERMKRIMDGESLHFEVDHYHKNGHIFSLDVVANIIELAEKKYILSFHRDLSERKQAEAALRDSEERFRLLAENAQDMIYRYRLSPALKCEYMSPAVMAVTGHTPEEFYADPALIFKITHPEDRKVMQGIEHFPVLLPTPFVFRLIHLDGSTVWIEQMNTLIYDEEARVEAFVGIARDITQRKKMEEEILNYQEQLRSLASELSLAEERERRRMAIDLHDYICQPLAVSKIKLAEVHSETSVESASAKTMKEVLQYLEQTLQDTRLFISRLSPPVLYDLGFEEAVEWVSEQISQQHGILITLEDDHKPKPLDDDIRIILFQAVKELLVNVVKHARVKEAQVSLKRQGGDIEIKVTDEGKGFNPKQEYPKTGRAGGFGLFSIRERLHHLGGSMTVKSEPGRGTEITLRAPLKHQ